VRNATQPTVTDNASHLCGVTLTHDAYGVIRLTNQQGGSSTLFGSDIGHSNRVCIEICRAKLERSLNRDWVYPLKPILSLEMSHAQFAQFIMSSGKYNGTECTLTAAPPPGALICDMPAIANIETKHATFRREIQEGAAKELALLRKQVTDLAELVASGKPKITELRSIINSMLNSITNLPPNMAYVVSSAEEALEKATSDAKIEVEAYIAATAQRIGLTHIKQLGQIENKEKPSAE
jgi:hypothetical protein